MAGQVYTYVDGESHFIRLEKAWQQLHGDYAKLDELRFINQTDPGWILHLPHAKVFWTRSWSPGQKTFYFTAASGDAAAIHGIEKSIRDFGLDHHVTHETSALAKQRRALLENRGVMEKAKAVDAAIFVRMLMDAQSDLYDLCNLYTSDVDYLPVIQEVMTRYGKRVFVHGFKSGLADYSPLETVPNQFVDLSEMLKNECQLLRAR
jgi:hypothetical protein